MFPKFFAALQQAFEELISVNTPENGFAASCLEQCMYKAALKQVQELRSVYETGESQYDLKGQQKVEEDFYLSSSDKLLYAMREFKSEMHYDKVNKNSNPVLVAKLDVRSVASFNFPRIKTSEVAESLKQDQVNKSLRFNNEDEGNQMVVARMIELAKNSVARPTFKIETELHDERDFVQQPKLNTEGDQTSVKVVEAPSMLRLCCNIIETLRLREELIVRLHETNVLASVYMNQAALADKRSIKIYEKDQIPLNLQPLTNNFVNLVDNNDGSKLDISLPFCEFDQTLTANLDFTSDSCIKALMTDLGVEEMRAILHYQIMQQQLLTVAVMTNQLVIDGAQKGLTEYNLLVEKQIAVPNSMLNLKEILSTTQDGGNMRDLKKEKYRMLESIQRGAELCMYWIMSRKTRLRESIGLKFKNAITKLSQQDRYNPETCLRIMRSLRIKELHTYCQSVLKEVYLDSLKIQSLQTCNELRTKAQLFPQTDQLFTIGCDGSGTIENLSHDAMVNSVGDALKSGIQSKASLPNLLQAQFSNVSIFYVPSTAEIMTVDRYDVKKEDKTKRDIHSLHELQDVLKLDQDIKAMVRRPTATQGGPAYRIENTQKYGIRKAAFNEAYSYDRDSFRVLSYLVLVLRIFNLEYIMGRNNSPGYQIQELENKVFSGRSFWKKIKELRLSMEIKKMERGDQLNEYINNLHEKTSSGINPASQKVIQRILLRKKQWIDLQEDVRHISQRVQRINHWLKALPPDRRTMPYICDMLILHHENTFYHFLNAMDNMIDVILGQKDDESFQKVNQVYNTLIKKQFGIHQLNSNGYFVNQASISSLQLNPDVTQDAEYEHFWQAYSPVVDEQAQIPTKITVIRRLFGRYSNIDYLSSESFHYSIVRNYQGLMTAFYNMSDEQRAQIGTNFFQLDESVDDYLMYKGMAESPQLSTNNFATEDVQPKRPKAYSKDHQADVLLAKVEFLKFKIEASHFQRIIMCWMRGGKQLPKKTRKYNELMRKFNQQTTLSLYKEVDKLNEQYWSGQNNAVPLAKQALLDPNEVQRRSQDANSALAEREQTLLIPTGTPKYNFFTKVNTVRAEANIIKRILEVSLIKIAISMITSEHSALTAAIDQCASESYVQAYVHPQQQFASTLYQAVDQNNHLDVVTKLGFVQQFLTRLRNRCTEVDTLTSGPGIVFSIKDFNECLQIFCKQAIQYGEKELRGRCETQAMREHQFHHLLYLKDMEVLYYRRKCEEFLTNVDNIVNAKISHKANQLIYEFDISSRELRLLKDNYFLMEQMLREEIRQDFQRIISIHINNLKSKKDDFDAFKKDIQLKLKEHVQSQMENVDADIRNELKKLGYFRTTNSHIPGLRSIEQYASMSVSSADSEDGTGKKGDPNSIREIISLTHFIRKFKVFVMMKEVFQQEKFEKKLREEKAKRSDNSQLWAKLAESEKREQITRQELELTKQTLNHYEKLIEKLYGQLEHINNQKVRLQQFKDSRSKQMGEMENKMKNLDVNNDSNSLLTQIGRVDLETIDLNKILDELRNRDKTIASLRHVDQNVQGRLNAIQKQNQNKLEQLNKKLEVERNAKMDAFEKLEAMRVEMKTVEGKDIKNDLWKDKCKELYEICKELENENEDLKQNLKTTNMQLQTKEFEFQNQINQLLEDQMTQKTDVSMTGRVKSGVTNMRENAILNRDSIIKQAQNMKSMVNPNVGSRRIFSSGTNVGQRYNNMPPIATSHNQLFDANTIATSNASFPGFTAAGSANNQSLRQRQNQFGTVNNSMKGKGHRQASQGFRGAKPSTAHGTRYGQRQNLENSVVASGTNLGGIVSSQGLPSNTLVTGNTIQSGRNKSAIGRQE